MVYCRGSEMLLSKKRSADSEAGEHNTQQCRKNRLPIKFRRHHGVDDRRVWRHVVRRGRSAASLKALLLPRRRRPVRRRELAGGLRKWPVPAACFGRVVDKHAAGTGHFWSPRARSRRRTGRRRRGGAGLSEKPPHGLVSI